MKTINLTFNKPFLKLAKSNHMTPLQVLQHLVSSMSFCYFYMDGVKTGVERKGEQDESADIFITEVFAVDVASIEETFRMFKRNKNDNLGGIARVYLTLIHQLGQQGRNDDELLASGKQLMKDWEEELEPLYNLPSRVNVYQHGVINLTMDFTLICILTGFSMEEALQVYIDRCNMDG